MKDKGRNRDMKIGIANDHSAVDMKNEIVEYLESLGYHILVRNFRCRFGEIDLIAKQDDTYIFIEVKYRTGRTAGDPTSAVDGKKQKKISKTADYYRMLHQIPMDVPCRFDVVTVTADANSAWQVDWLPAAFDASGYV